jgi:hypothetical protein
VRRNTKKLQDLDLARSPHLERDSIGEALDLGLLSPFPPKYATNSGGVKRRKKELTVNNGGERMEGKGQLGRRWKRGIYSGPKNMTVGAENGEIRAQAVIPLVKALLPFTRKNVQKSTEK